MGSMHVKRVYVDSAESPSRDPLARRELELNPYPDPTLVIICCDPEPDSRESGRGGPQS